MRILVPAISSATSPDGVSRHAVNLTRCLLYRQEVERVDLIIGEWQQQYIASMLSSIGLQLSSPKLKVHRASCQRPSVARNLWHYWQLPRIARDLASDVIHLTYPVPISRSGIDRPMLVTLHDLYPYDLPENFGYPRVLLNRAILRQCLSAADAIACVSDTTLARLEARFPSYAIKASCVYNCVEPEGELSCAFSTVPIFGSFILAVAQHRKSKNLPLTLSVFRHLLRNDPALRLIVIGNAGPESATLHKMLRDRSLHRRVVFLHGVTEQQLYWCYRNCELLLATSSTEGFGLPVVEAVLAGCRVVCSDIPAFREFGEAHCRFVALDALAEDSFVQAAQHVRSGDRPAPIELPHLSTPSIAACYMQLFRDLLSRQRTPSYMDEQPEPQKKGNA